VAVYGANVMPNQHVKMVLLLCKWWGECHRQGQKWSSIKIKQNGMGRQTCITEANIQPLTLQYLGHCPWTSRLQQSVRQMVTETTVQQTEAWQNGYLTDPNLHVMKPKVVTFFMHHQQHRSGCTTTIWRCNPWCASIPHGLQRTNLKQL
jgi:hypothetical protein